MRRTITLLAIAALALLLVGGVAIGKPRQEGSPSSQSPTTNKSEGEVSIQSTTQKASFASGTGANFLGVKVSNHGNLLSFESPAGQEAVSGGNEGYAVCSAFFTTHGHDTGTVEGGFGAPTFSQPTAGAFPLTVTRNTTDGKFQLKQVWNKPDANEKDVTVTMTVKNTSSATLPDVYLSRSGDFDLGSSETDQGARTDDSAWLWDDFSSTDAPGVGLTLMPLTFGVFNETLVEDQDIWAHSGERLQCIGASVSTPTTRGNFALRAYYSLGNLRAGQSKTVKFAYSRM